MNLHLRYKSESRDRASEIAEAFHEAYERLAHQHYLDTHIACPKKHIGALRHPSATIEGS